MHVNSEEDSDYDEEEEYHQHVLQARAYQAHMANMHRDKRHMIASNQRKRKLISKKLEEERLKLSNLPTVVTEEEKQDGKDEDGNNPSSQVS